MSETLRLLLVEDQDFDEALLLHALESGGYVVHHVRVETEQGLRREIASGPWDVVISDWNLPEFSALRALAVVREQGLELPFIIVSGTIGEETAVEAMRAGAHDFLMKDRLSRLIPVLEREISEAAMRREQKKIREQLVLSDRMSSIGMLAAGVAHEVNNPLAALIANLQYITGKVRAEEVGPEFMEALADARDAADRVKQIVRDLKVLSRAGDDEQFGTIELVPLLESSLRMAHNEVRHRAKVVRELAAVPPVRGSAARLGQLFLNLIINAAQSIPEGRAAENQIRISTRLEGTSTVWVEVQDTGSGIPKEIAQRVFEPFFTTKPSGVGTGLGLAICKRIVEEVGGRIVVESEPGTGTTFRVALPVMAAAPTPVEVEPRHVPVRRARILVVDDEPTIARVLKRMLGSRHELHDLPSAREALQKIQAGDLAYDAILCDVMMPEMTGMELYEEIAKIAPDQARRMIFLTGGAFTERAREFLERVENQRVEKPFDIEDVEVALASVLEPA